MPGYSGGVAEPSQLCSPRWRDMICEWVLSSLVHGIVSLVNERVGVVGLCEDSLPLVSSDKRSVGSSYSDSRGSAVPVCPLIIPCDARKFLIFSLTSLTLWISLSHSGRFGPNPRHSSLRRTQVRHLPPSESSSSHFFRRIRHV